MPRLNTKICVVTGAARGIGRAIAERFHAEGAIVILTDIDETAGAETAAAIGCRFEKLDVREETDWQRLAAIVPVADVVVNNAGVTTTTPALDLSEAEWDGVLDTNLKGVFLVAQATARRMVAAGQGGSRGRAQQRRRARSGREMGRERGRRDDVSSRPVLAERRGKPGGAISTMHSDRSAGELLQFSVRVCAAPFLPM